MRLKYFILILTIITSLSLAYVWQETEIIKLAYQSEARSRSRKELLDRNRHLRYNLISLKSCAYLGNKLLNDNSNYEIPKRSQMMTLTLPKDAEPGRERALSRPQGIIPRGMILSALKIDEAWPVSVIKSYFDNHAQAQDINR